jgi:hypothetical protein
MEKIRIHKEVAESAMWTTFVGQVKKLEENKGFSEDDARIMKFMVETAERVTEELISKSRFFHDDPKAVCWRSFKDIYRTMLDEKTISIGDAMTIWTVLDEAEASVKRQFEDYGFVIDRETA